MSKRPVDESAESSEPKKTKHGALEPQCLKKLTKELADLAKLKTKPDEPGYFEAGPLNDEDMSLWEVRLFHPGALGDAMKKSNIENVKLGVRFPGDYPFSPPFVWIKYPSVCGRYIFPNGGMCLEILTPSGWTPATRLSALIMSIQASIEAAGCCMDAPEKSEEEARKDFAVVTGIHKEWMKPYA